MEPEEEQSQGDAQLKKLDLSLSFDEIGGYALPIVFYITIIFTTAFVIYHGFLPIIFGWSLSDFVLWSLPILLTGIVFHELIHGICFALLSGKPLSFVKYGFDKATLTPYAHCKTPIAAWVYKVGALMPAIILGVFPFIVSIATGNPYLFFFGTFFTTAACGDFIVFWIIKNVNNKALVEDHPKKAGCYIYTENTAEVKEIKLPGKKAHFFQKVYRIPFLFLVACTGAIFGYRVFRAISFYL